MCGPWSLRCRAVKSPRPSAARATSKMPHDRAQFPTGFVRQLTQAPRHAAPNPWRALPNGVPEQPRPGIQQLDALGSAGAAVSHTTVMVPLTERQGIQPINHHVTKPCRRRCRCRGKNGVDPLQRECRPECCLSERKAFIGLSTSVHKHGVEGRVEARAGPLWTGRLHCPRPIVFPSPQVLNTHVLVAVVAA